MCAVGLDLQRNDSLTLNGRNIEAIGGFVKNLSYKISAIDNTPGNDSGTINVFVKW